MKILFLTEGGENIGLGHLTRCIALAEGFREFKDKNCEVKFIINTKDRISFLFKGYNFKIKKTDWIKEYKSLEKEIKTSRYVVVDSYLAPKKVYEFISNLISPYQFICIDDYFRIKYPPSIVINFSVDEDKRKYYKNAVKCLLGYKYIILRKAFWNIPKRRIRKSVKNILITLGGSIKAIRVLKKIVGFLLQNSPSYRYHIISREIFLNGKDNVFFYKDISPYQLRDLSLKCDFGICAGGQTIYELLSTGLPLVGVYLARNQENNIRNLKKYKLLKDVLWRSKDVSKILHIVNNHSYIFRKQICMHQNRLINNKGVRLIINEIR